MLLPVWQWVTIYILHNGERESLRGKQSGVADLALAGLTVQTTGTSQVTEG